MKISVGVLIALFASVLFADGKLQYAIKHDPFFNEIERKKIIIKTAPEANIIQSPVLESAWNVSLLGIVLAGKSSMANIDGAIITLGEQYQGYLLLEVDESSAVFEKHGKRYMLSLKND